MIARGFLVAALLILQAPTPNFGQTKFAAKKPRQNANKVIDVETSCSRESFDIKVKLERPFKGIIFAKDFSRECKAQGTMDTTVSLNLPTNACGVRTTADYPINSSSPAAESSTNDLHYVVTLVVQMDRFLQQSSDQEVQVRCRLRPRAMSVKSDAVEEMLESNLREMRRKEAKKSRSGRMRADWLQHVPVEEQRALLERARAWMELAPADGDAATVEVGQPTALLVKSTLPAGIGLRITDCLAHDGLGESSQKLLDEVGCPIDELIFSKLSVFQHRPKGGEIDAADLDTVDADLNLDEAIGKKLERDESESMYKHVMSYQHAATTFAAFKFPDRAMLHLSCELVLCRGECPPVDCAALQKPQETKDGLLRRPRLDKEAQGNVIDRLEVYNSIEVLAPNIELEDDAMIRGSRLSLNGDELPLERGFSPGDRTVCLSPSKMALAFCILGLVFLCALIVAFVSLVRARRKYGRDHYHAPLSLYTGSKSLFSASGSTSSGLSGSKLLLTDSPFLDQQSSSSNNWPYGRVF